MEQLHQRPPGLPRCTYSLLVCDVQLRLGVRLQLVLFESCVDPSILHNLLQKTKRKEENLKGGRVLLTQLIIPLLCRRQTSVLRQPARSERSDNMAAVALQPQTKHKRTNLHSLCYAAANTINGITATSQLSAPLFSICSGSIALWGFTKDSQTNYQWSGRDRSSPQTGIQDSCACEATLTEHVMHVRV